MKKIILIIISFLFMVGVYAQLKIESGANLVVSSGATVVASNGITSDDGTIDNDGTIENKGDLVNNTSGLFASTSTGTFTFSGSSAQEITGNMNVGFYGTVRINNSNGVAITSTSNGYDQTIFDSLVFMNGKLILNEYDLIMGLNNPAGMSSTSYAQTNSTGTVQRTVPADGASNIMFPVGNSSYNPLILQNAATATADVYNVRVADNEPSNSGSAHMVDRSWVVTELVADGSELTVTPQWNSGEELASFDRTNSGVGYTSDAGTTYNWKDYVAASGSGPYTQSGTVFTTVGTFAVSDYDFVSTNLIVDDETIANTESDCFNASNTITVPGTETSVTVQTGGQAEFIAANNIIFKPGFVAQNDSYVHAYISTTYCGSLAAPLVAVTEEVEEGPLASFDDELEDNIMLYPNPTLDRFKLDFMGEPFVADIMLLNFQGKPVMEAKTMGENIVEIDISTLPRGVYVVVIKSNEEFVTKRVVKN
ncbi:MAG: T9SS type A sorting domain-containing protein [Bacteroidales bacterium]|nr:T9SS type A sorting domain-containing protein [Bacteroidales bacterium]MCF8350605.1 T9SS type A sorting domain-containing protein [Bacteroidales bacterium]MCF8377162.1 T9SS type A sorting domain-containing protein [Bacteroidales bacterium]